ncbi:MAG: hypothetical protein KAJ06_06780 [Gammaproteobacteria bacterium]|nr:hypothetical protein [Gammaproteobacteria bacterium]
MAIIDYLDGVDPIQGSRRGVTFDVSQAGPIAKRRPSPINPQTKRRNEYRLLLKAANQFFWDLNAGQKLAWKTYAGLAGITGPGGDNGTQAGCAAFFSCAINAYYAGDGFPVAPGAVPPIFSPTIDAFVRIDKDTIRVTFRPNPLGANKRLFLRQALPGPGVRRWGFNDGYIAEYTGKGANSPFDFTTHFQHITGWNGRYWIGHQNTRGVRSVPELFDL